MRPLGRVNSKFNWQSVKEPMQNVFFFIYIPHLKSKYIHWIISKLLRTSAIFPFDDHHYSSLFWWARSGPHDSILRDWSRVWPSLTWLTELVGVAVSSNVQNTISSHFKTLELTGKCGVNEVSTHVLVPCSNKSSTAWWLSARLL